MAKSSKKKEEDNRKLYEVIRAALTEMHRELVLFNFRPGRDLADQGVSNVVCGLRNNLFHLQDILWDLLFEGETSKAILKNKGKFPPTVHLH